MMPTSDGQSLRIALLNTADYAGGAETIARTLRNGLRKRGHDAKLWVGRRHRESDNEYTFLLPCNSAERDTAQRYARKGFFNLGLPSSVRFSNSAALENIDIIHLHNLHGHYFSMTAVPRLPERAPLVWTFHDFFPITGGCAFPFECSRWTYQCGSCPQLGHYPLVTAHDRTRRMHAMKRKIFPMRSLRSRLCES